MKRSLAVNVVVAAILTIFVIAVAIAILTLVAKYSTIYVAKQACKLAAFIKHMTDIKAQIAEHLFPVPIYVTSHTCDFKVNINNEYWVDIIAKKIQQAEVCDLHEIITSCKYFLKDNLPNDLRSKIQAYSSKYNIDYKTALKNAKEACKIILFYTSLAYLTEDAFYTFADAKMDIDKIYCIDAKSLNIKEVYEADLNRALILMHGTELTTLTDYKDEPFGNNKVAYNGPGPFVKALQTLIDLIYIHDIDKRMELYNCVTSLPPTLGHTDKIHFEKDPMKVKKFVCIDWIGGKRPPFVPTRYIKIYTTTEQ